MSQPHRQGFTLIELLVVVAVVALILTLAAPSFRDMLLKSRMRGTADQFITDVQFARTESVSRTEAVGIGFQTVSGVKTCYILYSCGTVPAANCTCNCAADPGNRCVAPQREIRTVDVSADSGVSLYPVYSDDTQAVAKITFDPATGGISRSIPTSIVLPTPPPNDSLWVKVRLNSGSAPSVRAIVNPAGRPSACAQGGRLSGLQPC